MSNQYKIKVVFNTNRIHDISVNGVVSYHLVFNSGVRCTRHNNGEWLVGPGRYDIPTRHTCTTIAKDIVKNL